MGVVSSLIIMNVAYYWVSGDTVKMVTAPGPGVSRVDQGVRRRLPDVIIVGVMKSGTMTLGKDF